MTESISTSTASDPPQDSLLKSAGFHILPGLLTTAAFITFKPLLDSREYPPLLAFLVAILVVNLPFLLGVMLYVGKKQLGRYTLDGVVRYREKLSRSSFALIFLGAFVAVYILMTLVAPTSSFLAEGIFSGLPDWMFLDEQSQYEVYSKTPLVVVFTLQLVLTGVVLPWVEELYFRGFLMPRIARFGIWTPLLGGLFFGLYHIWQVYSFPTVFLLGVALGYVVWWKRDIRLSISLHVFANALARLILLMAALAM